MNLTDPHLNASSEPSDLREATAVLRAVIAEKLRGANPSLGQGAGGPAAPDRVADDEPERSMPNDGMKD
ncbi:MAG: hypothetical protein JSS27_15165 [Planctomycetes bacterium]|nr:hypothetical protein [Planctomycetota bacterium]